MVGDRQAVARGLRKTRLRPESRLTSRRLSADKPFMNPQNNPGTPGKRARWRIVGRIGVAAALATAFLVMASVFSPQRSKAGDLNPQSDDAAGTTDAGLPPSTDPHEGLKSLGSLEGRAHVVHMYATPNGARYSVYEKTTGRELGVLMTPQRMHEWFPEIQLPGMDFSAPTDGQVPLMMAEPEAIEQ